jgi:hypothetical protein
LPSSAAAPASSRCWASRRRSSTAPSSPGSAAANQEVSVCVAYGDRAGITKFADLQTKEMTVGGTGASADDDQFPKVVNGVLGTKMKIVSGYPGGNDVVLAMERGELQGRCGWSWSSEGDPRLVDRREEAQHSGAARVA